jgi:hypothetical protein
MHLEEPTFSECLPLGHAVVVVVVVVSVIVAVRVVFVPVGLLVIVFMIFKWTFVLRWVVKDMCVRVSIEVH